MPAPTWTDIAAQILGYGVLKGYITTGSTPEEPPATITVLRDDLGLAPDDEEMLWIATGRYRVPLGTLVPSAFVGSPAWRTLNNEYTTYAACGEGSGYFDVYIRLNDGTPDDSNDDTVPFELHFALPA